MKRSIRSIATVFSLLTLGLSLTACNSNSPKGQDTHKQSVSARCESLRKSREEKSSAESKQIKKASN